MKFVSKNEQDTIHFAKKFANELKEGDVILLQGDLGAGKTTLVKYIVAALGSTELVTSPTFTLLNEYKAKFRVYHFDMYRLKNANEAVDSGLDEVLRRGTGICFVEWPEKVSSILPKWSKKVSISIGENGERIFEVTK